MAESRLLTGVTRVRILPLPPNCFYTFRKEMIPCSADVPKVPAAGSSPSGVPPRYGVPTAAPPIPGFCRTPALRRRPSAIPSWLISPTILTCRLAVFFPSINVGPDFSGPSHWRWAVICPYGRPSRSASNSAARVLRPMWSPPGAPSGNSGHFSGYNPEAHFENSISEPCV